MSLKENKELQNSLGVSLKENKELQFKYLEIKERYDLLIYQKFVRSAEQLKADKSQTLLFTEEAEKTEALKEKGQEELEEVKSYKRNKKGRKAIDPKIPRREKIIDIPESEKTCSCGAKLTRIGERNFGLKSARKASYNPS